VVVLVVATVIAVRSSKVAARDAATLLAGPDAGVAPGVVVPG
jgi:hypothetical protein